MANLNPRPDPGGDTGAGPDRGSTAGAPRWVKAFGAVALVLLVLLVVMLLSGHGPGGHVGSLAPTSGVALFGVAGAGGVAGLEKLAVGRTP